VIGVTRGGDMAKDVTIVSKGFVYEMKIVGAI
jgi:hypothetical protein